MLQLAELNRLARADLGRQAAAAAMPATMAELEAAADEAVRALRRARRSVARTWIERLLVEVERRVDTDTVEYLDRPEHPARLKLRQIRWLHAQNRLLRSYERYWGLLVEAIRSVAEECPGRPVRLLELGSGSGELALELGRIASRESLRVEIEGSDIQPGFVEDANRRAMAEGSAVRFRVRNAFDLAGAFEPGGVDVAFIAQTMHHFSAGQLAMMIAQVGAAGARRFVGMDGRRGLFLLGALPALCSFSLDPYFVHDAFVSVRRLHAEAELDLVASLAAPDARVVARSAGPFISMLDVSYPRRGAPA